MSDHHHHIDVNAVKADILLELGEHLTLLGQSHRMSVDVSKFIALPRKLEGGRAIGLLNEALPRSTNSYKLLVTGEKSFPTLTIFAEEPKQLNATFYRELTGEEEQELRRQLKVMASHIEHFHLPALLGVIFLDKEVEGYQYYEPTDEAPAATANVASIQAKRGPTPVSLSQQTESTAPQGRLGELSAAPATHRRGPTLAR